MIQYFPVVTGSLTVLGNINVSGSITTSGSITISGSITSASFASTASFVALAQSASNAVSAQTASFANTLTVAGNLTAQTLVVQTITSSVDFVTGSTRFGSTLANTHVFSGSVTMNPGGLFVSSSGNVGIGTITPTGTYGKLSVAGGISILDDNNAKLEIGRYSSGAPNSYIKIGTNSNSLRITNAADSVDLFTISGSGNVGINTTSPANLLHLAGASSTPSLRLGSISTGFHWDIGRENATTGDFVFNNANGGSTSERLRITVGGNVGIGTSSPTNNLSILGADQTSTPTLGTNAGKFGMFNGVDSGTYGMIMGVINNGNSYIQVQRIDGTATAYNLLLQPSGGNVGIGTTNPGYKLTVAGTIGGTDLILQGSTSLSYNYTTNSSWASGFQTIIPIQGPQSSGAVYLVRVNWGGGGAPYVVYGAFLWVCMGSNGGGVDNTITPMISTHQGGAGTMNFRNIAGGGQVASGIQVQLIGFADPNGGLGVTATRLM